MSWAAGTVAAAGMTAVLVGASVAKPSSPPVSPSPAVPSDVAVAPSSAATPTGWQAGLDDAASLRIIRRTPSGTRVEVPEIISNHDGSRRLILTARPGETVTLATVQPWRQGTISLYVEALPGKQTQRRQDMTISSPGLLFLDDATTINPYAGLAGVWEDGCLRHGAGRRSFTPGRPLTIVGQGRIHAVAGVVSQDLDVVFADEHLRLLVPLRVHAVQVVSVTSGTLTVTALEVRCQQTGS